ncbi:hypothetical protein PC128_g25134 [Phytophthora cactorum]|nr:hypothetical protein PC128_g25134 [Phytophthora cactorum]
MGTQVQVTPRSRAVPFAVLLSQWHLKVQRVKENDVAFAQLLQSSITSFVDLEESLAPLASPSKGSPTVRMDPPLLYARPPRDYRGFVMSFDESVKTENDRCERLPPVHHGNLAVYTEMNNGVKAAIVHGAEDLVIVGDSRLAIQQLLGVSACREESLQALLNIHEELAAKLRSVKYIHVVREYNAAADSMTTEAWCPRSAEWRSLKPLNPSW